MSSGDTTVERKAPIQFNMLHLPTILVAALGLFLSTVTYQAIRHGEEREIRLQVQDELKTISSEFSDVLNRNSEFLIPVRQLFSSVTTEEPYEFQKIVNAVTTHRPDLRAILWFFPSDHSPVGNLSNVVARRIPSGSANIGGIQYNYFKDYFVGPGGATGPTVYFDSGNPDALAYAFDRAKVDELAFDASGIRPLEAENNSGYSLVIPLWSAQPENLFRGFLVGNFAFSFPGHYASRYVVSIQEVALDGTHPIFSNGDPPDGGRLYSAYRMEQVVQNSKLSKKFRISVVPSKFIVGEFRTRLPLAFLILGILLTSVLTWHLHSKEKREGTIQGLFKDLVSSNDALRGEIRGREKAEADHLALERKMFKVQKMEAMARLAGSVAHDTNNYLCAISVQGELARMTWGHEIPELHDRIDTIMEACNRSTQLMKQLLAFGRANPPLQGVTEVDAAIRKSLDLLSPLLPQQLAVHLHLSLGRQKILLDPSGFDQILMNLVLNARDAIHGEGIVRLETKSVYIDQGFREAFPQLSPGHYALFSVSDTGSGIDSDVMEHLFEPFFTTKDAGKGTGLGLATVYGIVTQVGGSIEVESQVGCGATFELLLPIQQEK